MPTLTPFPHQETGAVFLAERGFAFLWDEPGLGKSLTVAMAAERVGARRVLVACPSAVKSHWAETFWSWFGDSLPITVEDGFPTAVPGDGVTVVSHAALADEAPPPGSGKRRRASYSIPLLREGAPYDVVVLDEAHEFRQFDAIRARTFWMPDGLWSCGRRVWALTGTPLVNSAADLWLPAFGPLREPVTWWDWCLRFCEMRQGGMDGPRPVGLRNARDLAAFLRPHALRRTLASLRIPLPPLAVRDEPLALADGAVDAAMADLDRSWTPDRLRAALDLGDEPRDAAMARVRRALGIAKAPSVAAHVHGIMGRGEGPVVVFFHHTDVRKALYESLKAAGWRTSWIDGKVTRPQLRVAREWFQDGRIDVILVQTQAGGTGLTLTRASRCVVAELPWTAVALDQAVKRIHRLTQERPCEAHVFRASGCWLEDALATVVGRKRKASEELLSLLETNS